MVGPQGTECQDPLEAGRGRKGPPLERLETALLVETLLLDFWPPELWQNTFLSFEASKFDKRMH